MKKLAVVALGGNALLESGQTGTIEQAETNAYQATGALLNLVKNDYNLVLTHGNGPQVGNILLDALAGVEKNGSPLMPLDVLVAYSQGYIGYILEKEFRNHFLQQGIERDIFSVISQVLVDKDDPAFQQLTKPVGPYYDRTEMEVLREKTGDEYAEDARGRGWRKVVASPKPIDILNHEIIGRLAKEGIIVIAAGGGGIPVYYKKKDRLQGMEAVIDKDLASALLAKFIGADELIILTDISKVFVNFNQPNQKAIDVMTVEEAKGYLAKGEFSKGSMGPKVKGCIEFVEATKKTAIIGRADELGNDNFGTRIIWK